MVGEGEGWQERKETQVVDKLAVAELVDKALYLVPEAITCCPLAVSGYSQVALILLFAPVMPVWHSGTRE